MPKSVLIVEDDSDIQDFYRFLLQDSGLDLIFASKGEDALLEFDGSRTYDLILLDVVLPGMDGEEFFRVLREERKSDVPVIICSVDRKMADKVERVGKVQGVYLKGGQGKELTALIKKVLEMKRPRE